MNYHESIVFNSKQMPHRSRSLCSLTDDVFTKSVYWNHGEKTSSTTSESSVEVKIINDSDSETYHDGTESPQSWVSIKAEALVQLEKKIDQLSDLFLEQCRLLSSLKSDLRQSRAPTNSSYSDCEEGQLTDNTSDEQRAVENVERCDVDVEENSRAKSLLDAIEATHVNALDREIREALTSFLQSDEVSRRVSEATCGALRGDVRGALCGAVPALCAPALLAAHRRLARSAIRALDDAFLQLEEHSSRVSRQMARTTRQLRLALQRHEAPPAPIAALPEPDLLDSLRRTVEESLDKEMKVWRHKVLDLLSPEGIRPAPCTPPPPEEEAPPPAALVVPCSTVPTSEGQSKHSLIDHLMMSAVIKKQIQEDDVNGAFVVALSAADLRLVVAACGACPPAAVRRLRPPLLLALAQQLATDMLQDTWLQCRFLEETLQSLSLCGAATRVHLPLVVGELHAHLSRFLAAYPHHFATERITLILIAADNLLKSCQ